MLADECAACRRKSSASPAGRAQRIPIHGRAGAENRRADRTAQSQRQRRRLPPRIESLLNSFSDRMERNEFSSGEQYRARHARRPHRQPRRQARCLRRAAQSARRDRARHGGASGPYRGIARRRHRAPRRAATTSSAKSPRNRQDAGFARSRAWHGRRRRRPARHSGNRTARSVVAQPLCAAARSSRTTPRVDAQPHEPVPRRSSIVEPKLEPTCWLRPVTVAPSVKAGPPTDAAARADRSQSAAGLSARARLRRSARAAASRPPNGSRRPKRRSAASIPRYGQLRIDEFHRRRAPRRAGRGAQRAVQRQPAAAKTEPAKSEKPAGRNRSGSASAPCWRAPASSCSSPAG